MTRKAREKIFSPYHMLRRARDLRRVAEHLHDVSSAPKPKDHRLQVGSIGTVPILLSLATEIALKAWQCRERNGPPDPTHDLLKLFLGLGEDAQRRLSEKMPEHPAPVPGLPPMYPGMQTALSDCRHMFVEWRYAHERRHLSANTSVLRTALNAILEAYDESPQRPETGD